MAFQDVAHGLSTDSIAQVHQGTHNAVISPGTFSWAMRTTKASRCSSMRGRPSVFRCLEPSNF